MYNISAGWGALVANRLANGMPGKIYVVGASAVAHKDMYKELFDKADPNGKIRFSSTVALAMAKCVADAGDTIIVLPGHTEAVTSSSLNLNVAGVNVVCLGSGSNRPTFTFGAAAATVTVSAANVSWKGGLFVANFLDVASAFTLGAAINFKLEGAEFRDTSAILNFLSIVTTGTGDLAVNGLTVAKNYWYSLATATLAFVSILGDVHHMVLEDNYVDKASTSNVGHFLTITADTCLGARIQRNILVVVGATNATVGIFMTGSSTDNKGVVSHNLVMSLDTTTELIATAGTGFGFFENYYTGTADASGKIWPAADAA